MAKNIHFKFGDQSWDSGITKVDRDKVYGWVEEVALDDKGNVCAVASLLDDGSTLILTGTTALKTLTLAGAEISKKDLIAFNEAGEPAELIPSVFDREIELSPATMDDFFDLEVKSVYQLSFEDENVKMNMVKELAGGKLMKFTFNYRNDYSCDEAMLLTAQNEIFILTGTLASFTYLSNGIIQLEEEDAETGEEEELDFGLL